MTGLPWKSAVKMCIKCIIISEKDFSYLYSYMRELETNLFKTDADPSCVYLYCLAIVLCYLFVFIPINYQGHKHSCTLYNRVLGIDCQ